MVGKNMSHTNAANRRCLARWTAAVMLGAAMLLTGCSSTTDGPVKKPMFALGKNARDESIRKQAHSDSFPTAKQAGLMDAGNK
jgi:hypothetical protein